MTCDECRDLLQEHIDEEAGPAERSAVDAHLEGCEECTRLRRQLAKFTTTLIKSVSPARPSKDFASKVLKKYHESKDDLRAAGLHLDFPETPAAAPGKTYPLWPFAAGIAVAVTLSLYLLVGGRRPGEKVGALVRGAGAARVLAYEEGSWRELPGHTILHNGHRLEAVAPAGAVVEIDLTPLVAAKFALRAPGKVQVEREAARVLLLPTYENPGRLLVRTQGLAAGPIKSLCLIYDKASVEIPCTEVCAVDIEPGASMELTVSVRSGSARVKNKSDLQTIAEGFARTVPQNGPCGAASQAKPEAFAWAEEP